MIDAELLVKIDVNKASYRCNRVVERTRFVSSIGLQNDFDGIRDNISVDLITASMFTMRATGINVKHMDHDLTRYSKGQRCVHIVDMRSCLNAVEPGDRQGDQVKREVTDKLPKFDFRSNAVTVIFP